MLDQLASLRDHLGQVDKLAASAPSLLDPPDTEKGRAVTADFPVDPQDRPTDLPASYNREPGPWDEVTVESVRAERARERQDSARHGGPDRPDDDDAIEALAANFSSEERGANVVATDSDEFETDTFPKITDTDSNTMSCPARLRFPTSREAGSARSPKGAIGGR